MRYADGSSGMSADTVISGKRRKLIVRYVCSTGKINYTGSSKPGNMNKFLYTRAKDKRGKKGKK